MYKIVAQIIYAILIEEGINAIIDMVDADFYAEKQSRKWIRTDVKYSDLIEYSRDPIRDSNNIPITPEDVQSFKKAVQNDKRLYYLSTLGVTIGHDIEADTMFVFYPQEWDFDDSEYDVTFNGDDNSLRDSEGTLLANKKFSKESLDDDRRLVINEGDDFEADFDNYEAIHDFYISDNGIDSAEVSEFYLPAISSAISKKVVDEHPFIEWGDDEDERDTESAQDDSDYNNSADDDEDEEDIFKIIFGEEWDMEDD